MPLKNGVKPVKTGNRISSHHPIVDYDEIRYHFLIFTDGSRLKSGKITAGGVIRSDMDVWFTDFMHDIGVGEAFETELCGIYDGLKTALDFGCKKVELVSDSSIAIAEINSKLLPTYPCAHLIVTIIDHTDDESF